MGSFETFILLMFAATVIIGISQKLNVPYPICLVFGGIILGFNAQLQTISFDPDMILKIVLPPVLYYAAIGISIREFTKNWKEILSLALGLVLITTLLLSLLFKWVFPQFPWALAFTFGALISPPDAVAVISILKKFNIGNRLQTVLEGESMINDAAALVLYRISVVALLTGAFSFVEGSLQFVETVSGGVIFGLVSGYLLQHISKKYFESVAGVIFSFAIPYITYVFADLIGVSGVLAVVINGLVGSRVFFMHHASLRRILGYAAWDIYIIWLNGYVFILMGLQLHNLTSSMTLYQMSLYTGYALIFTLAMILIRMLWVYARTAFACLLCYKRNIEVNFHHAFGEAALLGWSGMRGIVSLAAALALPYHLPDGMLLAGRNELIYITLVIILISLFIPGLTLQVLINWLKLPYQTENLNLISVKTKLRTVAEKVIQYLFEAKKITEIEREFLLGYFNLQFAVLEISSSAYGNWPKIESIRKMVIQNQRRKLLELWEKLEIDDRLLKQLEHELDLAETTLIRAEIK